MQQIGLKPLDFGDDFTVRPDGKPLFCPEWVGQGAHTNLGNGLCLQAIRLPVVAGCQNHDRVPSLCHAFSQVLDRYRGAAYHRRVGLGDIRDFHLCSLIPGHPQNTAGKEPALRAGVQRGFVRSLRQGHIP